MSTTTTTTTMTTSKTATSELDPRAIYRIQSFQDDYSLCIELEANGHAHAHGPRTTVHIMDHQNERLARTRTFKWKMQPCAGPSGEGVGSCVGAGFYTVRGVPVDGDSDGERDGNDDGERGRQPAGLYLCYTPKEGYAQGFFVSSKPMPWLFRHERAYDRWHISPARSLTPPGPAGTHYGLVHEKGADGALSLQKYTHRHFVGWLVRVDLIADAGVD